MVLRYYVHIMLGSGTLASVHMGIHGDMVYTYKVKLQNMPSSSLGSAYAQIRLVPLMWQGKTASPVFLT